MGLFVLTDKDGFDPFANAPTPEEDRLWEHYEPRRIGDIDDDPDNDDWGDDDPPPVPTAPLALVDCPECGGSPESDRCRCSGSGVLEVCGGCLEVPTVDPAGLEVCGCSTVPVDPHPEVAYGMAQGWLTAESAA